MYSPPGKCGLDPNHSGSEASVISLEKSPICGGNNGPTSSGAQHVGQDRTPTKSVDAHDFVDALMTEGNTLNPKPSTLNPQPSTLSHKP